MSIDWTPHRFSGGVLALDVANTVVYRLNPQKRFDRFERAEEISRFASALNALRAEEFGGRVLEVGEPEAVLSRVVSIREATDALFRDAAQRGGLQTGLLAPFLRAVADGMAGHDESVGPCAAGEGGLAFEAALAVSSLGLLAETRRPRVRVCASCAWLFLDRSRNGSRTWCDMAVCGNRRKASRHYRRRRQREDAYV
ncbi:MAG: CGNR zinc finger domain-containing protein [Methylobacterium mesophilicum]|nr:CGNR zinc finger domain-containing protein [Methylobacterium mesophilicum]